MYSVWCTLAQYGTVPQRFIDNRHIRRGIAFCASNVTFYLVNEIRFPPKMAFRQIFRETPVIRLLVMLNSISQ